MRHDKLEKELQLMLLMTENRQYTVTQLCERLDISRRNLYYYLDFFRSSGFQVEKRGTCYSLDKESDFFRRLFRTIHFTEDEAITMRRILQNVNTQNVHIDHLKRKLDTLYDLDILNDIRTSERCAQHVSVLYEAIKLRRSVVLHRYSSPHSQTVSDRVVEPFEFLGGNNEVRCYEPTSKMNKTFKLVRIGEVELLADGWRYEEEHRRLYTDAFLFSGEEQHAVRLRLDLLARNLLVEEFPRTEPFVVQEDANHWLLATDVCSYAGIGRFVLGLYDHVEVLADDSFRQYIDHKLQAFVQSSRARI